MTMLVRGGAAAAGSALPATATAGQVLQWNGSAWVAATPSASGTTPNATPTVPGLVQLAGDLGGTATAPTVAKINGSTPAPVATSGKYGDLTGAPALAPVATSGAYTDLTGRPALATVATSGSYGDLTGRPLLAPVATSGAYTDLTGRPAALLAGTKVSNTTITSQTTLTLDPELQVTAPVGWYLVQLYVIAAFASAATNGGLQGQIRAGTAAFDLLGPATYTYGAYSSGAAATVATWLPTSSVTLVSPTAASVQGSITCTFTVRVTTAGTLGFAWAQAASSSISTSTYAGSSLLLTKTA